jgi:hypothetical protein
MITASILRFSFILASERLDFLHGAVCLAGRGAVAPPSFSHDSTLGSEEWSAFLMEVLILLFLSVAGVRPIGSPVNELLLTLPMVTQLALRLFAIFSAAKGRIESIPRCSHSCRGRSVRCLCWG